MSAQDFEGIRNTLALHAGDATLCAGNYTDTYVKLDDGWRIQSRRSDVRVRPNRSTPALGG